MTVLVFVEEMKYSYIWSGESERVL